MANILIVYCTSSYPLRNTISDHLYAFERSGVHRCFYFNAEVRKVPDYFLNVRFDLIIFHTLFLAARWNPEKFRRLINRVEPLKHLADTKIAIPQDEFIHTHVLGDFFNRLNINHIFSVMPPSEWDTIYPTVDRDRTHIHPVLTGYLDDATLARVRTLEQSAPAVRPIDIGYRAWRAAFWLGSHGQLKSQIAERFQEQAPRSGLRVDISTRDEDTLLGDSWFEYLLRCKYTIGVEGGASILDSDGALKECTETYLRQNPGASFDEVEAHCFPGLDNNVKLVAISPRHLEACATRTCQILVEGDYNGILQAQRHYIALKRDFSNLDDILSIIRNDSLRTQLVEQAYQDIVASGRYTNESFVEQVLSQSLDSSSRGPSRIEEIILNKNRFDEKRAWLKVRTYLSLRGKLFLYLKGKHAPESIARWRQWYSYLQSLKD